MRPIPSNFATAVAVIGLLISFGGLIFLLSQRLGSSNALIATLVGVSSGALIGLLSPFLTSVVRKLLRSRSVFILYTPTPKGIRLAVELRERLEEAKKRTKVWLSPALLIKSDITDPAGASSTLFTSNQATVERAIRGSTTLIALITQPPDEYVQLAIIAATGWGVEVKLGITEDVDEAALPNLLRQYEYVKLGEDELEGLEMLSERAV